MGEIILHTVWKSEPQMLSQKLHLHMLWLESIPKVQLLWMELFIHFGFPVKEHMQWLGIQQDLSRHFKTKFTEYICPCTRCSIDLHFRF